MEPIEFVEVFSDCTRWLAYDVFQTDFGGTLLCNGLLLEPSLTGAIFGLVAAASSQLTADVLYAVYRYGPTAHQTQVFGQTHIDWAAVYATRAVSSAALFGVYEFSEDPISCWIQGTLVSGVYG